MNATSYSFRSAVLKILLLMIVITSAGCTSRNSPVESLVNHTHLDFLKYHNVGRQPQLQSFEVCASVGCDRISTLGYTAEEWQGISALFVQPSADSAQERERIGVAVAMMERLIGPKNNTSYDQPRNSGLFTFKPQLDCIAESANTTVALMLLEQQGLLIHHRIIYPRHRGLFTLQAPHNAAAIEELETGRRYVVDSWFFANGEKPVIVPAELWKSGYEPDDA